MHGYGQWRSAGGDSYVGEFVANLKEGWGVYRWSNGNVYEGRFAKGVKMDQHQHQHQHQQHQQHQKVIEHLQGRESDREDGRLER